MTATRQMLASADEAAKACAQHILSQLDEANAASGSATLAVSGGSTPQLMFGYLAKAEFDWKSVHLFWVDERAVPADDPNSNYKMADDYFISPSGFPRKNVHRIHGELEPEKAARMYSAEIREFFSLAEGEWPHFDVVHLGMGPDGHTASLFPGDPAIDNREGLTAAVHTTATPPWRITLLPGALLPARNTLFLVAGADKAERVREVFEGPLDPVRIPAQLIARQGRRVTWFLDDAAARLLG